MKENKHYIYSLHRSREEKIFIKPSKIIGVITADKIIVTIDERQYYAPDGLYLFSVRDIDPKFVIGVLNFNLFIFLYRLYSLESGRVLAQVKPTILNELPFPVISSDGADTSHYECVVNEVNKLINLYSLKLSSSLQSKIEQLQSQIEYCEDRINNAVYYLYNLSKEEIGIVEEAIKN